MRRLSDEILDAADDVDRRLRAALEPTHVGARTVADRALAGAPRRGWRRRTARLSVAAALALMTALGVSRWRAPEPAAVGAGGAAARISSVGRLVIVENDEGETWIRGSSERDSKLQPGSRIAIVLKEVSP
jgi:anti-sigma-K factor RskA